MKRSHIVMLVAAVLAVSMAAFLANYTRTVQVRAGERIECTYGHVVSDSVKSIKVPAREAAGYSVKTTRIVCDKHRQAEALYSDAQQQIADGKLKAAKKTLAKVVALDPSFMRAKSQIDQISSGKKPTADGATPTSNGSTGSTTKPSTPGDSGKPTGPVASLVAWMPDTVAGYRADKPVADAMAVSREYVPDGGKGDVLVIAAEQIGSPTAAKEALRQQVSLPYSRDGRSIKVNGRTSWIGTDGSRYATLGIVDGPVLVVLQVSSSSTSVSVLADELLAIAKTLPK